MLLTKVLFLDSIMQSTFDISKSFSLTLEAPWDIMGFCRPFLIRSPSPGDKESLIDRKTWKKTLSNFSVSTVPADVLALLVSRTSAVTMLTKFKSCIYSVPAFER